MVCLGDAHMKLNRFMESKVIFEDALQIYQKLDHDLVHVDVPDLLYSLSSCCTGIVTSSDDASSRPAVSPGPGPAPTSPDSGRVVTPVTTMKDTQKYLHLCLEIIQQLLDQNRDHEIKTKLTEFNCLVIIL
jgi:hypothetical protein